MVSDNEKKIMLALAILGFKRCSHDDREISFLGLNMFCFFHLFVILFKWVTPKLRSSSREGPTGQVRVLTGFLYCFFFVFCRAWAL